MKYTVLIGRPIQAGECAYDTYLTTVEAEDGDVAAAQRAAQLEACAADHPGDDSDDKHFPGEYEVLMVIEGEHADIKVPDA